jgi:hypothetical protein
MTETPEDGPQVRAGTAPFDPSNSLLAETPAELTVGIVQTPSGQRLAFTLRTASTTLTVFPDRQLADTWRGMLASALAQMNGLIIPPGVNG